MANPENGTKPVDLDGLGAAIGKIKEDFARKSEIPAMNYATREEILALFDDETAEAGADTGESSGDGESLDGNA